MACIQAENGEIVHIAALPSSSYVRPRSTGSLKVGSSVAGQLEEHMCETGPCTARQLPHLNSTASTVVAEREADIGEDQWTTKDLITELTTSLLDYGAPSHRMEEVVRALGASFSTPTAFYYLPTYAIVQFPTNRPSGTVNGPSSLYLIKTRGSMNFHKLPMMYDLVKGIIRNGLGLDEVKSRLRIIRSDEESKKEFPLWAICASYPFAAMTSAIMFFHGSWRDAAASAALAIIPAVLRWVSETYEYHSLWWTYEMISCFIVSIVATAIAPYFCYSSLILSAPVTLLPGYTVTAAVVEVMTKNIIAGSVRLCYTVVYLTCMTFGLTFGSIIFHLRKDFDRRPNEEICLTEGQIHHNHLWLLLCVPLYVMAYNVYLKSPYRQWPSMIVIGSLGYASGYVCKHIWHAPPEINGFVAAFTIGVLANTYTKVTDSFSFNTIVAGVFIQVPGSWGIRGMLALAYRDYDRGLYYCYEMLAICIGIAGALLMSNHLIFKFDLINRGSPHMDF